MVSAARAAGITRYALVPCGRGRARGADIGDGQQDAHEAGAATCIVERDLRDGSVILGAWSKTNPHMKQAAKSIIGFKKAKRPTAYLQKWYLSDHT